MTNGRELWQRARNAVLLRVKDNFAKPRLNEAQARFAGATEIVLEVHGSRHHRAHLRKLKSWRRVFADEFASLLEAANAVSAKTVAPFWTIAMLIVMCSLFSFIAAESSRLCFGAPGADPRPMGPWNMYLFIKPGGPVTVIDTQYLYAWGAFFLKDAVHSRGLFRWITNSFLHLSLRHCMSNMIIYCVMSAPFEMHVGTCRMVAVWFASALGGTFTQAVLGDPCVVLVGASGTVYGVLGSFVADTVLFWNTSKRPYMRCAMILSLVGIVVAQTPSSAASVSNWAHVGGCVFGFAASVLVFAGRTDARAPFLLKVLCGGFLVVLPILSAVSFARGNAAGDACGTVWELPPAPVCPT